MVATENFESKDNLRELDWVKKQTQEALKGLKREVDSPEISFYETTEDGKVKYHMDVVKEYLTSIKDKKWEDLKQQNTSAWIMSVQIALESMGYDVGKIDGIFSNKGSSSSLTKRAVAKFQQENGLKSDGQPGTQTINKILELLGVDGTDGRKAEDEGQKVEDDGRKAEDEGQKVEDDGRKAEDEGQKVEDDGRKAEDEGQKVEDDGRKAEDEGQKVEDDGKKDENIEVKKESGSKTYKNGDIYEGDLVNGIREGQGMYVWKDTNIKYIGGWKNGKVNGAGKMIYPNGVEVSAIWNEGKIKECSSYGQHINVEYRWFKTPCLTLNGNDKARLLLKENAKHADILYTMNLINFIVHSVESEKKVNPEFMAKGNKLQVRYNGIYADKQWSHRKYDYVEDVTARTKGLVSAEELAKWLNQYFETK